MEEETAKALLHHAPLIPSWTSTPIPSLSFSAISLLALADLGTVARRTAVVGGTSWLDALVLAPGLHYQQAADALLLEQETAAAVASESGLAAVGRRGPPPGRGPLAGAEPSRSYYAIRNVATADYLRRLWAGDSNSEGDDGAAGEKKRTVVVDVRMESGSRDADGLGQMLRRGMAMFRRQQRRQTQPPDEDDYDDYEDDDDLWQLVWLSNLLYILSPLLTLAAAILMVLLGDFWGLSSLIALMLARLLNIFSIRQRSRYSGSCPSSPPPADNHHHHHQDLTEYVVEVSPQHTVLLRGLASDVQAVTTRAWLRERSPADGYREAAGKMLVYGVAAFGGNMTQAGSLLLAGLLLTSAALLGLSNAKAGGGELRVHGRVARPERRRRRIRGEEERKKKEEDKDLEKGR